MHAGNAGPDLAQADMMFSFNRSCESQVIRKRGFSGMSKFASRRACSRCPLRQRRSDETAKRLESQVSSPMDPTASPFWSTATRLTVSSGKRSSKRRSTPRDIWRGSFSTSWPGIDITVRISAVYTRTGRPRCVSPGHGRAACGLDCGRVASTSSLARMMRTTGPSRCSVERISLDTARTIGRRNQISLSGIHSKDMEPREVKPS
jgi:hypothetical protein